MTIERFPHNRVLEKEQEPQNLDDILKRFNISKDNNTQTPTLSTLSTSILDAIILTKSLPFQNNSKKCPYKNLVMGADLLVGHTDPGQIRRIEQIFCGTTVEEEDSMGLMSGRKGKLFRPLSHCWKTTIELHRLVEFMKEKEIVPIIKPDTRLDENSLKDLLNKRSAVRERNGKRQSVFVTWSQFRDEVNQILSKDKDVQNTNLISGTTEKNASKQIVKQTYDARAQLDVGGLEYQDVTKWVESSVLEPLADLVGHENINIYTHRGEEPPVFYMSFEKTAQSCENKPVGGFYGSFS
jgi:hypothetical protein